jgi:hypothetical protein
MAGLIVVINVAAGDTLIAEPSTWNDVHRAAEILAAHTTITLVGGARWWNVLHVEPVAATERDGQGG